MFVLVHVVVTDVYLGDWDARLRQATTYQRRGNGDAGRMVF